MNVVRLTRLQLNELRLLLAGIYGEARRYELPGTDFVVATLRLPTSVVTSSIELMDHEGSLIGHLEVEQTRVDGDGAWIAGMVAPTRVPTSDLVADDRFPTANRNEAVEAVLVFLDEPLPELPKGSVAIVVDDGRPAPVAGALAAYGNAGCDVRVFPSPAAEHATPKERVDLHLELARRLFSGNIRTAHHALQAKRAGLVVLLTGLSGSGKSTIAQALATRVESECRRSVTMLDGDEIRNLLSSDLGFSRADRELNLRRLGWVASIASKHGGIAICPVIAPYASSRVEVRSMAMAAGRFVLVHVATKLDVCELRDRKGLYARARAGEIQNFTGVSDPYEEPVDADLILDTATQGVAECVERIWEMCFRDEGTD